MPSFTREKSRYFREMLPFKQVPTSACVAITPWGLSVRGGVSRLTPERIDIAAKETKKGSHIVLGV